MCLWIPPAACVASATAQLGDNAAQCVTGLREAFLPSAAAEWQRARFQKLLAICASSEVTKKTCQLFLDVLALHSQQGQSKDQASQSAGKPSSKPK